MRKLKKDNTIEEVTAILRDDQPKKRKKLRGCDCKRDDGLPTHTLPRQPHKKHTR